MCTVSEIKLAALKLEIAAGIRDLARGRFQAYYETNLMQLPVEVGQRGRIRLSAAKAQKKNHRRRS